MRLTNRGSLCVYACYKLKSFGWDLQTVVHCVCMHAERSCSPCQSSVDYGNTKITQHALKVSESSLCPSWTLYEQSSGAVWWTSRAPVPNKPTVSVDVKQHFSQRQLYERRWGSQCWGHCTEWLTCTFGGRHTCTVGVRVCFTWQPRCWKVVSLTHGQYM